MFIKVDLPEPDAPIKARNSPSSTCRSTSPRRYVRVTPSRSINARGIVLPASGLEEARCLTRAGSAFRGGRGLGDDDLIAFGELGLRDLRRGAVFEPDHERHRRRLAVAEDPRAAAPRAVAAAGGPSVAAAGPAAGSIALHALGPES